MRDDHDRLTLRQREQLAKRAQKIDDGFYYLFFAMIAMVMILTLCFVIWGGCAAGDQNLAKLIFGEREVLVPASMPSRTHFDKTQKLARDAAKDSEQTLTKMEKWELYGEYGLYVAGSLFGILKTWNALKRRKARAT